MENYARYRRGVVSLSQGIPFVASDELIREDVVRAIFDNKVDRYSDPRGILELRTEISNLLFDECMSYSEEEIIVSVGAIEGLSSVFLSLLSKEKNEVIIPTPTYSAYFRVVDVAKGKTVPFVLDEKNDWELDIEQFEKKITSRTAAILICNPNNPTGSIYSRETLIKLSQTAKKHNIYLVVDEVYKNMIYGDATIYTPGIDDSFRKNIIRVVSFSKDFSLTGWRVGFFHSDKEIIEKILPVHDALVNCTPVISQYAALSALTNQEMILAKVKSIYNRQRIITAEYLNQLGDFLTYKMPKGSYYFFPKLMYVKNSAEFCLDLLVKENVALVPGSDFGKGGEGHVRICFGRAEDDVRKGMEYLTRYLYNNRQQFAYGR